MSDLDHNVAVQAPAAPARYLPVMPAGRPAPRVASSQALRARPLVRALARTTSVVRRLVSLATLSIPFAYLVAFFVGGGLLRPELASGKIGAFIQAVVRPGLWLFDHILAKRLVDVGWNFELLILGGLLFIPRHFLLLPFQHLDHWAADLRTRSAYGAARVAIHPGAGFVTKPAAREPLPASSALGKA